MIEMGRPKTVFLDLPPRMTARRLKSGKTLYYYGQQKVPLGSDLNRARIEWARLENGGVYSSTTFLQVSDLWQKKLKDVKASTAKGYGIALGSLSDAFGHFQLESITAQDVREYLDKRSAKVSANREVAILSIIWNWCRERGMTNQANPCAGVRKNRERPRTRYIHESEFNDIRGKGCGFLRDAMDLALLTSQRPQDLLSATLSHIKEGYLEFVQQKTGAKLRFRIEGELKTLLERPRSVRSVFLIADDHGQPIHIQRLQRAFQTARKAAGVPYCQFRDLRAKAVSDEPDLKTASGRAGHADEKTTARVYRRVKGDTVRPLR